MRKVRKIDYILEEKNNQRLIFRFYPRRSSCHSFNENPPKSWNEVYKVYYSYAVIRQYKFKYDYEWESFVIFEETCDECSIINEVASRCRLLSEGQKTYTYDNYTFDLLGEINPPGMGTSWIISKTKLYEHHTDNLNKAVEIPAYDFMLFTYQGKGTRFTVKERQMKDFGEYLNHCCEYMLKHGESI